MSGVSGIDRTCAPIALATAVAIAPGVGTTGGSPRLFTLTSRSSRQITGTISGTSIGPAILYMSMFGLTIAPVWRLRMRSSNKQKLSPWMTAPVIWFSIVLRFTGRPTFCSATILFTRMMPVSVSTLTSANCTASLPVGFFQKSPSSLAVKER